MRRLLTLALMIVLAASRDSAAAEAVAASKDEQMQVAAKVHSIFEAKCADCHGSHLPKPKGKFGHILDLKRVAENIDYVIPGNVEESEIYQLVLNNEMPGEDADVPPLTEDELKVVARWIEIGAPGEIPKTPVARSPVAAVKESVPFGKRVLNWFGKFHSASTHFPVALLLAAVLAEAGAWWLRRPEWTLLVRFLVVLGALSAIPTATLGWLAMSYKGDLANIYGIHKWMGTFTAVWALVCAVLICMAECEEGSAERKRFRGALMLGGLMVAVTGFLGGALAAGGLDHYKF